MRGASSSCADSLSPPSALGCSPSFDYSQSSLTFLSVHSFQPPLASPPSPPLLPSSSSSSPRGTVPTLVNFPTTRVSTEYDSDTALFFHKISCRLLHNLVKLKLSLQNNLKGEFFNSQFSFITKHLSILYDLCERNALVKGSFNVSDKVHLSAIQNIKAQQGEVSVIADLVSPSYNLEVSSVVPSSGLPRATFKFPLGEVSLQEKENEEASTLLSIGGIVKAPLLNGLCTAGWKDSDLNFRYSYKDEQLTFTPSIFLPSGVASFSFKRQFNPSDKLSYWYNFHSNYWSMVYKRKLSNDLKFKVGYDSEIRLGWASLWVGDEDGKLKAALMKMRLQFMVQVPQDDITASVLLFRVKKRWDF